MVNQTTKILVIDDHQLFIDGIQLVLSTREKEIALQSTTDATAALGIIESQPDIDLILLDISMPGLDGLALLTALRNRKIIIPRVVISAAEELHRISSAIELGALGFIPKSHSSSEMLAALDQVLQGNIYIPKSLEKSLARFRLKSIDGDDKTAKAKTIGISKRQYDVLKLVDKGYSNKQIATELFVSEHTVKSHVARLFELLQADNRTSCVRSAHQQELL